MKKHFYRLLSLAVAGAAVTALTATASAAAAVTRTESHASVSHASPAQATEGVPCDPSNKTWVHLYVYTDPYTESLCVGFAGNYSPNALYTGFCGGNNTGYIIVQPVLDPEGDLGAKVRINYGPGTTVYKFNNTAVFPEDVGYIIGVNIQKWSGSDTCPGTES